MNQWKKRPKKLVAETILLEKLYYEFSILYMNFAQILSNAQRGPPDQDDGGFVAVIDDNNSSQGSQKGIQDAKNSTKGNKSDQKPDTKKSQSLGVDAGKKTPVVTKRSSRQTQLVVGSSRIKIKSDPGKLVITQNPLPQTQTTSGLSSTATGAVITPNLDTNSDEAGVEIDEELDPEIDLGIDDPNLDCSQRLSMIESSTNQLTNEQLFDHIKVRVDEFATQCCTQNPRIRLPGRRRKTQNAYIMGDSESSCDSSDNSSQNSRKNSIDSNSDFSRNSAQIGDGDDNDSFFNYKAYLRKHFTVIPNNVINDLVKFIRNSSNQPKSPNSPKTDKNRHRGAQPTQPHPSNQKTEMFKHLKIDLIPKSVFKANIDNIELADVNKIIFWSPDFKTYRRLIFKPPTTRKIDYYLLKQENSIEKMVFKFQTIRESRTFKSLMRELSTLTNFQDPPKNRISVIPTPTRPTPKPHQSDMLFQGTKLIYKPRVVIDKREFRSQLPGALYFGGFNVVPMFLKVGDYILGNETVIERKSLQDFEGSLKSGRLEKQIKQMFKKFNRVFVLIEFAERETLADLDNRLNFGRRNLSFWRRRARKFGFYQKLNFGLLCQLIVDEFPRLRILVSFSPKQSFEYFRWLKGEAGRLDLEKFEPFSEKVGKQKNLLLSYFTPKKRGGGSLDGGDGGN